MASSVSAVSPLRVSGLLSPGSSPVSAPRPVEFCRRPNALDHWPAPTRQPLVSPPSPAARDDDTGAAGRFLGSVVVPAHEVCVHLSAAAEIPSPAAVAQAGRPDPAAADPMSNADLSDSDIVGHPVPAPAPPLAPIAPLGAAEGAGALSARQAALNTPYDLLVADARAAANTKDGSFFSDRSYFSASSSPSLSSSLSSSTLVARAVAGPESKRLTEAIAQVSFVNVVADTVPIAASIPVHRRDAASGCAPHSRASASAAASALGSEPAVGVGARSFIEDSPRPSVLGQCDGRSYSDMTFDEHDRGSGDAQYCNCLGEGNDVKHANISDETLRTLTDSLGPDVVAFGLFTNEVLKHVSRLTVRPDINTQLLEQVPAFADGSHAMAHVPTLRDAWWPFGKRFFTQPSMASSSPSSSMNGEPGLAAGPLAKKPSNKNLARAGKVGTSKAKGGEYNDFFKTILARLIAMR